MDAKLPVPTFSELIFPIIEIIEANGGSANNEQITKGLEARGFETETRRGTRSELEYRAAWAKTYLKAYGGLVNPKMGHWTLTDKGRSINRDQVSDVVNFVARKSRAQKKVRTVEKAKIQPVKRKISNLRPAGPAMDADVTVIDQVKTIMSLLSKGHISKAAASAAILELNGGKS